MQAVHSRHHDGKGPASPFPEANAGSEIQNQRNGTPNGADQINPLEDREKLSWRGRRIVILPHRRIGEDGAHQREMQTQEANSGQRQPGSDDMEYGEQCQMAFVSGSLFSSWNLLRNHV